MIKSCYGKTEIEANGKGMLKADFCCITESVYRFFIEDGMTEEEAKKEVRAMVERALEFDKEEYEDKSEELLELLSKIARLLEEDK